MYRPLQITEFKTFPTGDQNKHIQLPKNTNIQIGDIIVTKYNISTWARWLP